MLPPPRPMSRRGCRPCSTGFWSRPRARCRSCRRGDSGVVVRACKMAPARSRRATVGAVWSGRLSAKALEPKVVISPLTGCRSLIATGMPSSGRGRPSLLRYLASARRACASARSKKVVGKGVERGVDLLHAGDHRLHELDRREPTGAKGRKRLARRHHAKLVATNHLDILHFPMMRRQPAPINAGIACVSAAAQACQKFTKARHCIARARPFAGGD